jgi:hypothetical protein
LTPAPEAEPRLPREAEPGEEGAAGGGEAPKKRRRRRRKPGGERGAAPAEPGAPSPGDH